jgi:hypothetical protein
MTWNTGGNEYMERIKNIFLKKESSMAYYERSLRMLAYFNFLVGVGRILTLIMANDEMKQGDIVLAVFRVIGLFLTCALLLLASRKIIKLRRAIILSYFVLAMNTWIAFSTRIITADAFVSLGLMVIVFSIIILQQFYREEKHWTTVCSRNPLTLDLRVKEPSQLFDPLVVGPHLEINTDIADAVQRFVVSMKEMAPLDLCIYCPGNISPVMQETAIEAFQEHFSDEERRIFRVLRSRNRRSMILFIISMMIMFTWTPLNNSIGTSVLWTILGNMGGFFLWEIGNTLFRHADDYLELEHVMICKGADITFL